MTKKSEADPSHPPLKPATRLVVGGRDPTTNHGFVNPPVYHASTVLYPSAEDFLARRARYVYGRRGTPTSEALELRCATSKDPPAPASRCSLPGLRRSRPRCSRCSKPAITCSSPTASISPTRKFCNGVLKRYGIATTYYDPLIGAGIAALIQPNTRAVFVEAPGSLSFEVQDVPAIAAAAHAARRRRADGQHLGKPALFPRLRQGRRSFDPSRHQVCRRAFRRDARHRVGERRRPGTGSTKPCTRWAFASARTTSISACADCAPWACDWRSTIRRG